MLINSFIKKLSDFIPQDSTLEYTLFYKYVVCFKILYTMFDTMFERIEQKSN